MTTIVVATHNKAKLAEMRRIMEDNLGDLASDVELVSAGALGLADPVETGTTFEQNALLKARFVAEQTGLPAVADDSGLIVDVMGSAPGILSARWCGRHGDDKANNELLLAQLADIPDNVRTARFRCAAALVVPGDDVDNTDADTEEFDMPHVGTSDVDTPGADIPDVDMPSAIKTDAAKADDATSAGSKRTARGARHSIVYAVTRSGEMPGVIIRKARGNHGFGYDPIFVPDDQPGRKNADGLPLTSAEMTAEEKNAISHRGKALRSLMPDIAELLESGNEWDASELQTTRRVVSEAHE